VDSAPPKQPLASIIRNAVKEDREILTETESKRFLEYYNIPVVKTRVAKNVDEAVSCASQTGYPIALKILSLKYLIKQT